MSKSKHHWVNGRGYIVLRLEGVHPLFPGKEMELQHRVVMAEHLGRRLRKGEEVHHRNPPRSDNRLRNLVLKRSHADHMAEHRGTPCSPETRRKISEAKKGHKKGPAWRKNIGKALKGRVRSEAFKKRVSDGMKKLRATTPVSVKTRKRLSAAAKRRYARRSGRKKKA